MTDVRQIQISQIVEAPVERVFACSLTPTGALIWTDQGRCVPRETTR
ncbi:MAG: hypothetical protein M3Y48_00895 [Actinomycetota bacterium]|nr:hypothetical protein [Actinomycetota bacterium]